MTTSKEPLTNEQKYKLGCHEFAVDNWLAAVKYINSGMLGIDVDDIVQINPPSPVSKSWTVLYVWRNK